MAARPRRPERQGGHGASRMARSRALERPGATTTAPGAAGAGTTANGRAERPARPQAPHCPPRATCAVGYLRRSTDRQEQSIPDQQKAVEAYCAQHGLALLRCYTDDAISGTSALGRRAFQQMLTD